jgi:hypothetical protein
MFKFKRKESKRSAKGLASIAGGVDRPDISPETMKELHNAAADVAQHRHNADTNINKGDNFRGPVIAPSTPDPTAPPKHGGRKC